MSYMTNGTEKSPNINRLAKAAADKASLESAAESNELSERAKAVCPAAKRAPFLCCRRSVPKLLKNS